MSKTPYLLVGSALGCALIASSALQAATPPAPTATYIVRMAEAPAASYTGGVAGLNATKPAPGRRLNITSADVQAYSNYLATKQVSVASTVSGVAIRQRFTAVFNGFTANMTPDQADALRKLPGVAAVRINTLLHHDTSTTPRFLGLEKPNGLWQQLGGKGLSGENIVIGLLDTGITPENPSFADHVDDNGVPTTSGGRLVYGPPPSTWKGTCDVGPGFKASDCNNKLIGARMFKDGFEAGLAGSGNAILPTFEFLSPRDGDGHGSHTASTAAGNNGIPFSLSNGVDMGKVSGMAPRARVAMYKVCWNYGTAAGGYTANGCSNVDVVAGIEQAVKDGVNVLSASLGSAGSSVDDVDIAFLGAVDAGIFVSAAAGNSGPYSTVTHGGPWTATVAASSHDRQFRTMLTLGNGARFEGAVAPNSPRGAFDNRPLVTAASVSTPNYPLQGIFGPETCAGISLFAFGKDVVCENPYYGTALTSLVVNAYGARAVAIHTTDGVTELSDASPFAIDLVPSAAAPVKAYVAQAGAAATATAELPHLTVGQVSSAPTVPDFSSRGPSQLDPTALKPDFAAPGVVVLGAYIPALSPQQYQQINDGALVPQPTYTLLSGTSMATPHVAGVAALLMQRHPDWSVSAIKSALTTTAYPTKLDPKVPNQLEIYQGLVSISPWAQGAGQIDPTQAADPGLVYDVTPQEYRRYLCRLIPTECAGLTPLAATDLNLPSIGADVVAGQTRSVTRRVTNVGSSSATYQISASVPGFTVQASPPNLTLMPGETKSFTLLFATTGAEANVWKYGRLNLSDGVHHVNSNVILRNLVKSPAPQYTTSTYPKGSVVLTVGTPTSGALTAKATTLAENVYIRSGQGTGYNRSCEGDPSSYPIYFTFDVPQGTRLLAYAPPLRSDLPQGTPAPTGLYVQTPKGNSTLASSFLSVQVDLTDPYITNPYLYLVEKPTPGTWKVCALDSGFGTVTSGLHVWTLPGGQWDLKALGPGRVQAGGTASVAASWSAPAGKINFGWVDYTIDGNYIDSTWFLVDTGFPQATILNFTPARLPFNTAATP